MELKIIKRLNGEISQKYEMLKALKACGMETECEELSKEIAKLEFERQAAQVALTAKIHERVPETKEATILIMRYVCCEKYSSIASKISMTDRHVYRLHASGLKAFTAGGDEIV